MSSTFLMQKVNVGGGKVIELSKSSVEDIFQFGEAPYVIVGKSMGGKTTLVMDILDKHAKDASSTYFFTATKESISDKALRRAPGCILRNPDYNSLSTVWDDIVSTYEAWNIVSNDLLDIISKFGGGKYVTMISNHVKNMDTDDGETFTIEVSKRIIWNMISDDPNLMSKCDSHTLQIVHSLYSTQPRTILILDDVTAQLNLLKNDTTTVMYKESNVKVYKAYHGILLEILTRARHMNTLVCFFVHDVTLFSDVYNMVNNLVAMTSDAALSIANKPTLINNLKDTVKVCSDHIFKPQYPYHFMTIHTVPSIKADSKRPAVIGVGKADLGDNRITLSETNEIMSNIYDKVVTGADVVQPVIKPPPGPSTTVSNSLSMFR